MGPKNVTRSEFALVVASRDHILKVHINEYTLLNNVMSLT